LDRESPIFPKGTGSDEEPIELPGVKRGEFENLLKLFYDGMYELTLSVQQWTSILSIATRFKMAKVRAKAIFQLNKLRHTIDPVEQIVLSTRYNISEWLSDAYVALCEREKPLSAEEGRRLGDDIPYLVAEAREKILRIELDASKILSKCTNCGEADSSCRYCGACTRASSPVAEGSSVSPARRIVEEVFGWKEAEEKDEEHEGNEGARMAKIEEIQKMWMQAKEVAEGEILKLQKGLNGEVIDLLPVGVPVPVGASGKVEGKGKKKKGKK